MSLSARVLSFGAVTELDVTESRGAFAVRFKSGIPVASPVRIWVYRGGRFVTGMILSRFATEYVQYVGEKLTFTLLKPGQDHDVIPKGSCI